MGDSTQLERASLQVLLDHLDVVVFVVDMQSHKLLYLNQCGRSIWGDAIGTSCWKTMQATQQGPCPFCVNPKLLDAQGNSTGVHIWEACNSVNQRWYQCRAQAIPWEDGRWVRLEMAVDISERRKTEQLNRKTTEILQMIATGQPAEQIYNTIALLYESRHPGLRCSMLTLQGNKLIHGGAPSLPEEYCQRVNGLEYGPAVGSCGTATYTGQRVLVEDIASDPKWAELKHAALKHGLRCCWSEPIKDSHGRVMGAFGMYYGHPALPQPDELVDLEAAARLAGIIMEREQRETLLRKLSNSLDQSGEAVVITDTAGTIEYTNSAFEKLTGYSAAEALEKKSSIIKSDKHTDAFYRNLWQTIRCGEIWSDQISQKRKDGTRYPAHLTISPVKDDRSRVTNYIGIHRDLSAQQRLEEQLRQAQKMEAIGTLVGGLAHEFNNTLAGITGNLFLAKKKLADSPSVIDKLEKAEQLANQAAETIRQLLAFTRKGIVQKRPIPVSSCLQESLKLYQVSIPENVRFDFAVPATKMVINGDLNQLQQVLINLLNNARDAVAQVENPNISVRLSRYSASKEWLERRPDLTAVNYARICVSDNGCGVPPEIQQRIFNPFFTTKSVDQGSGLGLAMVYGAIESHGGFIEVEQGPAGVGTTFCIYLPLLDEKTAILPEGPATDIRSGNGETILLADDNEDVLETGKELLEDLNYQVLTAQNGVEALEIYHQNKAQIDLLMLDVVMPRMGGIEALKQIRQENPEIKAIFCTGYDRMNPGEKVDSELVLTKPFGIAELSQKISSLLN